MYGLERILSVARDLGASDIHLAPGLPPRLRIDGALEDMPGQGPLSEEACEALGREMAGEAFSAMERIGELDLALTGPEGLRCRVNLFRQRGAVSAAIRLLAERIPELERLGLPPAVPGLAKLRRTGSGKSTTLAALLERINCTEAGHIVTLEDPIEYLHKPQRCVISQREIGRDTRSCADGLRAALREDPDVILIGEMRDRETIETAITAAETGHLVFATLHTGSAPEAVDRIVDAFPEGRQRQIRLQLSSTLMAVLSQQLLPRRGGGRVLACEVMMVTPAIRNLIREGKTPQIAGALATGAAEGSVTMDNSLLKLVRQRQITAETALRAARDAEYVRRGSFAGP